MRTRATLLHVIVDEFLLIALIKSGTGVMHSCITQAWINRMLNLVSQSAIYKITNQTTEW